jgi:hypothetical protein
VQPPIAGVVAASSSAVLNLEKRVAELTAANDALKHQVEQLQKSSPPMSRMGTGALDGSGSSSSHHHHHHHHGSDASLKNQQTVGYVGSASLPGSNNSLFGQTRTPDSASAGLQRALDDLRVAACSSLGVSATGTGNELAQRSPGVDSQLRRVADEGTALARELEALRQSKASLQRRWEEAERDIEALEADAKEKAVEWERERDSLKRRLGAVEKDVQEADSRERDACLTMNSMDAMLSEALWALKNQRQS